MHSYVFELNTVEFVHAVEAKRFFPIYVLVRSVVLRPFTAPPGRRQEFVSPIPNIHHWDFRAVMDDGSSDGHDGVGFPNPRT